MLESRDAVFIEHFEKCFKHILGASTMLQLLRHKHVSDIVTALKQTAARWRVRVAEVPMSRTVAV